jgi:hypothetical protein
MKKKKNTDEDRQFWALAESTSRSVEGWPEWKRQFASGKQQTTAEATDTSSRSRVSTTSDN